MDDNYINILYDIKKTFGIEAFENSRRINSILLDLAPEMNKERIQIVNIINAGGYRAFKENFVSYELVYYKLLDILENEYGIKQEIAHWTVGIFSQVFFSDELNLSRNTIEKQFNRNSYLGKIAVGTSHTVVLTHDGTAIAVGDNSCGQCDVKSWEDVKAIFAKEYLTVGLTKKKTVLVAGNLKHSIEKFNNVDKIYFEEYLYGIDGDKNFIFPDELNGLGTMYNFENFTDLKEAAIGAYHYLGLQSTGKVVATGSNEKGQLEVHSWRDIVSVAAGFWFSVGLVSDGTVVACGSNLREQCEVTTWDNVLAIYTTGNRTVGLRKDGTVLATGSNDFGECNVGKWKDIVAISLSDDHTVGLSKTGFVYATGRNDYNQCDTAYFKKVVAIAAGDSHTIGLRMDGTLVDKGANESGQCNIEGIVI